MINVRRAAAAVVLAGLACSSTLEPRSGITLLATNSTCLIGRCDSLEVLAFPSNQPNTPGGYWSFDLGLLTTPEACFKVPASAAFRVIGVNADGSRDTTTFTWTSADPLSLGAQAASGSRIQASPTTAAFVPATAAGWRIAFPTDSRASPGAVCAAT